MATVTVARADLEAHLRKGYALSGVGADEKQAGPWLDEWSRMTAKVEPEEIARAVAESGKAWIEETGTCPTCGNDPVTHEPADF